MYRHDLPHPNPLPLGEGTAMIAFLLLSMASSNPAARFCLKQGAFLPLPAGEGRGEGENDRQATAITYLKSL